MKLNKIFAGIAASAVAASTLAVGASAALIFPKEGEAHPGASTAGNWLVQVFNVGNPAENKPATDYGLNVEDIARIDVTFEVCDDGESREWFEGGCGGSVITSCNGGTMTEEEVAVHNWPSNEWWGVTDEALELDTKDPAKKCQTEKVGDYTYKVSCTLTEDTKFLSTAGCVQIGLQEWGDALNFYKVIDCSCFDASGNLMISFDFNGNPTLGGASAPSAGDTAAAPSAGDVAGATDSTKGSPDTGIEDVAVVAGLAIVAGGAVLVSKKRK